jgi:hypothetical protein
MKTELNQNKMCNYKISEPQPENIPYENVLFESECGLKVFLKEGRSLDWRDTNKLGQVKLPSGKCMKCNGEINNI